MTGETHRAGGMLVSIIGFEILRQKGLLLPDINDGLQWLVMYPFTMWGSIASDLDHHWESCPSKSYPDMVINKALHITKPLKKGLEGNKNSVMYKIADFLCANHRSWQTHSDWTLWLMLFLLHKLLNHEITLFNQLDTAIATLIMMGITMGIIAHFILDIITPDGVWIMEFVVLNLLLKHINIKLPEKLHLVPKSHFFATGGKWEMFIRKVLKVGTVVALLWFLISIIFPDMNILNNIYFEGR